MAILASPRELVELVELYRCGRGGRLVRAGLGQGRAGLDLLGLFGFSLSHEKKTLNRPDEK